MFSPGRYVPDPTAGIDNPNDLPPAIIQTRSRNRKKCRCPHCNYLARRHDIRERPLHHIGDSHSGRPIEIILIHSLHYCCKCKTYFNIDTTDIADPGSHYTKQGTCQFSCSGGFSIVVLKSGIPFCIHSCTVATMFAKEKSFQRFCKLAKTDIIIPRRFAPLSVLLVRAAFLAIASGRAARSLRLFVGSTAGSQTKTKKHELFSNN